VKHVGLLRALVLVAAVGALEGACRTGLIPVTTIIPPSQMVASLWDILHSGAFNADILLTLGDVLGATVIAVLGGFGAGLVIHAWPGLRAALEPLLASYYAVPTFMFYPVFIILFGVGSGAIIAIAVLLAVVSMISATLIGLDRIPPVYRRVARIHRMGRLAIAWRISLPAALPFLFTGIRLCVAYAFIGVIASEFILSGAGIGYAIAYAYNNFNNQTMYGLMLLVVVLVSVINGVLDAVDHRLGARRR
jgi:NitT/TauT family transport system permease protein